MKRPIIGYGTDAENDGFAILDCGHCQHIRHRPPFVNRPWATTPEGRQRFLGHPLDCVRCDRLELPNAEMLETDQAASAHAGNVPVAGWNELESGQWAQVLPEQGELRCQMPTLDVDVRITPTVPGIIPPQTAYRLVPAADARFHIEVYRVRNPGK